MKTAKVKITGATPLLMHADSIEWADRMEEWKNDPKNKKMSKAGDDRTPPWRWIGCLNHDGKVITIPNEYIMACIMRAAAQIPTGRGKGTFKSQSQSGLLCQDFHWPLLVDGGTISMGDINDMQDLDTFKDNQEAAAALGITLFTKRAKIGASKHIRVRPRFDNWSTEGTLSILDEQISTKIIEQIFEIGGRYIGLGDWRPGGKTPGPFGMFEAQVI